MTEVLEGLARRARQRVERELLALFVDDVVEESAELSAGVFGGGVGDRLHDALDVELGRQGGPHLVQRFELGAGGLGVSPRAIALLFRAATSGDHACGILERRELEGFFLVAIQDYPPAIISEASAVPSTRA